MELSDGEFVEMQRADHQPSSFFSIYSESLQAYLIGVGDVSEAVVATPDQRSEGGLSIAESSSDALGQ